MTKNNIKVRVIDCYGSLFAIQLFNVDDNSYDEFFFDDNNPESRKTLVSLFKKLGFDAEHLEDC